MQIQCSTKGRDFCQLPLNDIACPDTLRVYKSSSTDASVQMKYKVQTVIIPELCISYFYRPLQEFAILNIYML